MEQKILRYFDAELRAAETDNNDMKVEGYALKFNEVTHIGSKKWGFKEKINPVSVNKANLDDVIFNFNHSMDSLLAGTRNSSLQLSTDSIGLKITAKIIDTAIGRDVYKMIQDKLIAKMSFAATITEQKWTYADEKSDYDVDFREIMSFGRFFDVSAVTFPAYDNTSIVARSEDLAEREKEIYRRQINKINYILGGNKL